MVSTVNIPQEWAAVPPRQPRAARRQKKPKGVNLSQPKGGFDISRRRRTTLPTIVPERHGDDADGDGDGEPSDPPRLMLKAEVLEIAHCTYATLWGWMREGKFPRSRMAGGKSVWLSNEVHKWVRNLPLAPLKGDPVNSDVEA
jgi:predicted DNA-binding transcriptional regulator AlpA